MDDYLALDIFCNQYFCTETKNRFLHKESVQYFHRDVREYPFLLSDGSVNQNLFAQIENAFAFLFGNQAIGILIGEFWTVIEESNSAQQWGLFGFSEIQSTPAGNQSVVIHYALCSYQKRSMLSRTELIAALRRCGLIRQWGHMRIEARRSSFYDGYLRSNALLEQLNKDPSMQLVYGHSYEAEFSFWLDQIWKEGSADKKQISCFFCYTEEQFDVFAHNIYILPQILLFPGNPLRRFKSTKEDVFVPIRGNPQVRAYAMTISSVFGDNYYGMLFSAHHLDVFYQYLKTIPKSLGDENRVQINTLKNLVGDNPFPEPVSSARDVFLLQKRTSRKIAVTHFPFWLGRQVGKDGYSITDNGAVSRRHAYISQSNGLYYLTDNKTPNYTYIDDYRLSGSTRELNLQSIIRLGDEQFVFCIQ